MKKTYLMRAKRYIASVMAGTVILTSVPAVQAAVTFDDGTAGDFSCVENSGVSVIKDGDNSYLNISPTVDGADAVAAYEIKTEDGLESEISYDFKINQILNNENKIARISQGTTEFMSISTKNGSLVYRGNQVIYSGLRINRWYHLKISFNATQGVYDIYLDGVRLVKKQEAPVLATNIPAVFTLSAKYAPGFAIDNFSVDNLQTLTEVKADGDKSISLLDGKSAERSYTITAYDQNGNLIPDDKLTCTYSVYPSSDKVTVAGNGTAVSVFFSEEAPAGEYILYITVNGVTQEFPVSLKRYAAVPSSITIDGERVIVYQQETDDYQFSAQVFDQEGNLMDNQDVTYSLEGDLPSGISIDSSSGVITVTQEMPKDTQVTLRAELTENPIISTTRTLILQDSRTYTNDKIRFDTLLDYLDNMKLYGTNHDKEIPLIAKGLDSYTMTPAVWQEKENVSFVPSDLASMGYYYSTLDALYTLTGNQAYKDEVNSVYQYYLDYFLAENGMPQWGGHRCIDLDTHTVHYGYGAWHELKGHTPYMAPFFELDYEKAYKIGVGCWDVSVTDWDDFVFNRHGSYTKTVTDEKLKAYGRNYKYEYKEYSPRLSTNLTFRAACNDILLANAELYERTGDDIFKNSAMKLLNTYWNSSSDLRINTYQSTTAGVYGVDWTSIKNIWEIDHWWMENPLPSVYTMTSYGDRFYNQCADSLVEQGYITDDERWKARETYFLSEDTEFNDNVFVDWGLAKSFGEDSEAGQIIIDRCIIGEGNYLKYAYDYENNKRRNILIDGTSLTGFVRDRAGYYGNAGTIFYNGVFTTESFMGLCYAYQNALKYRDNPKYTEHIDRMWSVIQNYMIMSNMGDPGTSAGGSDMELNYQYDGKDPRVLIAMLYLYRLTDCADFLDMARNIASTIIEESMVNGFFVEDDNLRYIPLDNVTGIYAYALAMLEATVEGAADLIPEYVPRAGVLDFEYYDVQTGETKRQANETGVWYSKVYEGILPKEIVFDDNEITIKVGESVTLGYHIVPDDTANKGIVAVTDNPEYVTTSWDSAKIVGMKPGKAKVKLVALADNLIQNTIEVTVTE